MPRALEPGQRFPIVLECDREKPVDTQPRLIVGAINARQFRQLAEASEQIDSLTSAVAGFDALLVAIKPHVVGWENMTDPASGEQIPFDANALDTILDVQELWELFKGIQSNGRLSADDKKKSESDA